MSGLLQWLWLGNVLGPGARNCRDLLDAYGTPEEVLGAVGHEDLSPFLSPAQLERLEAKPEQFQPIVQTCERLGVQILTMDSEDYPRRLLAVEDAPPVLYATGRPGVLNQLPTVAMIGSRRPSQYGVQAAQVIGGRLAKEGVCIVSGLADGLDGECHKAAVEQGGVTVGVLGTAINKTYPTSNGPLRRRMEEEGAVISEFAPGEATNGSCFLLRNRLIAALSDAVCVVEARKKSGTMNTVHHAQRYGKTVFAVPGTIFSSLCAGTNELLEEGIAQAAAGAGPILSHLGLRRPDHDLTAPARPRKKSPQLSPAAAGVLKVLTQTPQSAEQITAAAKMDMAAVLAALLELELSGLAQGLAGGQYQRK